ncbi:MAG: hypothetical protein IPL61_21035 [Myxococcales bacterium]|nr:hypothetical protein [Myxococcales bacterium]
MSATARLRGCAHLTVLLALALALALACGCGLEVGPSAEWVEVETITGRLAPKVGAPVDAMIPVSRPMTVRVVTFNVEMGGDPENLAAAIRGNPAIASADIYLIQEEEDYPTEPAARASGWASSSGCAGSTSRAGPRPTAPTASRSCRAIRSPRQRRCGCR